MAKKPTTKVSSRAKPKSKSPAKSKAVATRGGASRVADGAGDAFIKLLQSPLVAELVAVAATAALAALAQEGFNKSGSAGKRTGRAVKRAGKAAANAIGQRLGTEIEEIKKAAKAKKT